MSDVATLERPPETARQDALIEASEEAKARIVEMLGARDRAADALQALEELTWKGGYPGVSYGAVLGQEAQRLVDWLRESGDGSCFNFEDTLTKMNELIELVKFAVSRTTTDGAA